MSNDISMSALSNGLRLRGGSVGANPVAGKQVESASAVKAADQTRPVDQADQTKGAADAASSRWLGLEEAVARLNDTVQSIQRQLQFSVDDDSGETIVKVVDRETDKVIRQIPAEEVLKMKENLREIHGLLFNTEA